MFGLAERAAGIHGDVSFEALTDGSDAGNAAQTSNDRPAKISFLRPVASIAPATRGSSKAFTVERSMIFGLRQGFDQLRDCRSPHAVARRCGQYDWQLQRLRGFGDSATTLCLSSAIE